MRALLVVFLLAAGGVARAAETYSSLDPQSVWVDARLHGSFAAGTGGRPAMGGVLTPQGEFALYRLPYGYQRGTIGLDLDAHLPGVGFGSVLHVAPTPMFRLHFTFGGPDVLAPLPDGATLEPGVSGTGDLGYVLAIGNGVQLYRRAAFVLLGYALVGLEARRRWYATESFLWAEPTLQFGARALYETKRWRVRGGYEAQPPFFGRTEHRLELMVGLRPFEDGRGPFFGLRLYGHAGQTPVSESGLPPTWGMSELQGGVGLEVGL